MTKVALDAIDRKILKFLIKNARMPFLEIARECGISGAAIHQRIRKLDEAGVILGSRLVVNPKMMGFDVCAHVSITLRDPKLLSEAIEELKKVPEIVECHFITGAGNILVKLYCVDNEHLMRTIFDGILHIQGLASTETFISLQEVFQRETNIDSTGDGLQYRAASRKWANAGFPQGNPAFFRVRRPTAVPGAPKSAARRFSDCVRPLPAGCGFLPAACGSLPAACGRAFVSAGLILLVVEDLLHERVELAALLLGRAPRAAVAEDEDRLARDVELVELLLRRRVEAVGRDVLRRLAARHQVEHLVGVGYLLLAHGDAVADPDLARGLGIGVVHRNLVRADGVGRVAARLEDAHGPEVFVQSDIVHDRVVVFLSAGSATSGPSSPAAGVCQRS